jgi:hypothetical protein
LDRLYRDAIIFSVRSLTIMHNYTSSPFSWYTKRLRDVYTSSFLALGLASRQMNDHELMNSASSALLQLYPIEDSGSFAEHGLDGSALGRLLQKAKESRHALLGVVRPAHIAIGGAQQAYPTRLTSHTPTTLATSSDTMTTFQSSGNLFEDFETMIQEPLWSAGLSAVDNPFGNWV